MEMEFCIKISPSNCWRTWFVYQLFDTGQSQQPLFVGWCEARDLLTMGHARQSSACAKFMKANPDADLILVAISRHPTKEEAARAGGRLVHQLRPEWNMSGYIMSRKKRVVCLDNGLEFNSVTEAALWCQCAVPSMSAHLSRKPGYLTMHGFTFERVE